jgi:hypothetical protein
MNNQSFEAYLSDENINELQLKFICKIDGDTDDTRDFNRSC